MEQPRSLYHGGAMRKVDQPGAAPALAAASDLPVNGTTSFNRVGGGRGGRGGGGGGGFGGGGGSSGMTRMAAPDSDCATRCRAPAAAGPNVVAERSQSPTAKQNAQSAIANPQSAIGPPSFAQHMVRTDEPMTRNSSVDGSVVLTSFQIERAGEQVRIVDADGSVYEGTVVNQATPNLAQAVAPAEQRAMQNQIAPQEAERRPARRSGGQTRLPGFWSAG